MDRAWNHERSVFKYCTRVHGTVLGGRRRMSRVVFRVGRERDDGTLRAQAVFKFRKINMWMHI